MKQLIRHLIASCVAILGIYTAEGQGLQPAVPVFTLTLKENVPLNMTLVYNAQRLPAWYQARVISPVCESGICYSIEMDLFWDLTGAFLRYESAPGKPLTKFDHIEFTTEDYQKLNRILANRSSPLSAYTLSDLIDTSQVKRSKVIDAVTGATQPLAKNLVVPGAVYTTYTLWHIFNGEAATRIQQYTDSLLNQTLLLQMLNSALVTEQYFALNRLKEPIGALQTEALLKMVTDGQDYIPLFAIAKIPDVVWVQPRVQERLLNKFPAISKELRTELLNRLIGRTLSKIALSALARNLQLLNKQQLHKALTLIDAQPESQKPAALTESLERYRHQHDK